MRNENPGHKYRGIKASIQLTKQWCLTEVTSYKHIYIYLQQHICLIEGKQKLDPFLSVSLARQNKSGKDASKL
jgi:hypothetical protein